MLVGLPGSGLRPLDPQAAQPALLDVADSDNLQYLPWPAAQSARRATIGNFGQHSRIGHEWLSARLSRSTRLAMINIVRLSPPLIDACRRRHCNRHHERVGTADYVEQLRLRRAAAGPTQRDGALLVRPSQLLLAAREQVLAAVTAVGGSKVRVFGSVARGDDRPGSDVDLVVTFPADADIVTLLTLEEHLSDLLTVPVNLISAGSSGLIGEHSLADALPL